MIDKEISFWEWCKHSNAFSLWELQACGINTAPDIATMTWDEYNYSDASDWQQPDFIPTDLNGCI